MRSQPWPSIIADRLREDFYDCAIRSLNINLIEWVFNARRDELHVIRLKS